jgi:hypothetical protein
MVLRVGCFQACSHLVEQGATAGCNNSTYAVGGFSQCCCIVSAGASLLGLPGVAIAATATRLLLLLSMILAVAFVEAGSSSSSSSSSISGVTRWWRQPGAWEAVCSTVKAGFSWKITWTFLALGIPGRLCC